MCVEDTDFNIVQANWLLIPFCFYSWQGCHWRIWRRIWFFEIKNQRNWFEHIEKNIEDPSVDKILVSSHKDVRDALVKKGIPFVLVYPNKDIKDEYIQRYKDRGNNDAFVELLDKN